jgi:hypothetical protein
MMQWLDAVHNSSPAITINNQFKPDPETLNEVPDLIRMISAAYYRGFNTTGPGVNQAYYRNLRYEELEVVEGPKSDIHSIVGVSSNANSAGYTVAASFAGTKSKKNWKINFRTNPVKSDLMNLYAAPYAHGRIPLGFSLGFKEIRYKLTDTIRRKIREAEAKGRKVGTVALSGHSLGGVLAVYSAAWLKGQLMAEYPDMRYHVITLGTPRVGSETFRTELSRSFQLDSPDSPHRFYHFMHSNDPVVTFRLFNWMMKGYAFAPGNVKVLTYRYHPNQKIVPTDSMDRLWDRFQSVNHMLHPYEASFFWWAWNNLSKDTRLRVPRGVINDQYDHYFFSIY